MSIWVQIGYAFYGLFITVLVIAPIFAVINSIQMLPKLLQKEVTYKEILVASYEWCIKVIQYTFSCYGLYVFLTGKTDIFIF